MSSNDAAQWEAAGTALLQKDTAERLRYAYSQALPINPDAEAQNRRNAAIAMVPVDTARALPDVVKNQAQLTAFDAEMLNRQFPKASSFLVDPENAKIAHDDIPNLTGLEQRAAALKPPAPAEEPGPLSAVGSAVKYLGASLHSGALSLVGTAATVLDAINPFTTSEADLATLYKNDPAKLQATLDNSPATGLYRVTRAMQQGSADVMGDLPADTKARYSNLRYDTLEEGKSAWRSPVRIVGDALQSLPTSIGLGVAAYLTKGASARAEAQALAAGATAEASKAAGVLAAERIMAQMGAATEGAAGFAQQAAQTREDADQVPDATLAQSKPYQDLLAQGYDPKTARVLVSANAAEQAGLIAGVVDAAVNFVGGKALGHLIGEGGRPLLSTLKGAATEGLTEAVQSPGEQLGQNMAMQANMNPGQDLTQGLLESALQGLAVGGLSGGVVGRLAARSKADEQKAQAAEALATTLTDLQAQTQASKLLTRSPELLRTYMQELADQGVPQVFVDAAALAEAGVDLRQLAQDLPSVAEQLPNLTPGGDLAIPTGELLVNTVGSQYAQALIDHARAAPDEMSRVQAQQYQQQRDEQLAGKIDEVLTEQGHVEARAAEVAVIESRVLDELNALGRFKPKVNEQYAALMGSYFSTMAARVGISPAEFARTYALQFSREAAPEGAMDQAASSLDAVQKAWDDAGIKHSLSESGDLITVSKIIVPEFERGSGKGTAAMQVLVDYAEAAGKHIALSPSVDFGGNKKRLVQFYKRFGFVENKGRNRAFTTSESMHREAPGKVLHQAFPTVGAFGPVFEGLEDQPAKAIDKLLAVKEGEVPGAFVHPELGPIALVYGNEHFGLAHIEARRGAEFLQQLPDILATGRVVRDARGLPRVYLVKDGEPAHVAVVRLDWDGEQKTWVVTAYRDHNGKFAGGEKTSDTSAQNSPEVPTGEGGAVFSQETGPDSVSTAMQEFKQAARAQISMADDITSQPSVMSLLENADWSSFLHESGHFFLEVQADLASRIAGRVAQGDTITDGEQSLLDDFNATLNWFGITGTPDQSALATWLTMSTDERRPYHEKWARGFEAYAFEGKAPSLDLQKAFQTFRAWLLSIYKRLSALNVKLTDEVRDVMGRMLATADQISEAEAARNLGPLFATPEQGGMTPEEYRAYHDLSTQATLEAADTLQTKALRDMQWQSGARSKMLKSLQAQHDAERERIRHEVRGEVMSQPVYQAWQFLTGKQNAVIPGKTVLEVVEAPMASGRLRTSVLREMYGIEETAIWRKLSARHMTSDTAGLHPDNVAEIFGYESGDEMVRALAAAEDPKILIDARTDQRMLEEHGELATPEGLAREADRAVLNEVRMRFIAREQSQLQRATSVRQVEPGQRHTTDLLLKAAKIQAEAIVSRLKLSEVRPKQYAAAAARNARQASQSMADLPKAAEFKRNQLANMAAARAASEAQDEIKAAGEFFKKVVGTSDEKIKKTRDVDVVNAARAVLALYGFGAKAKTAGEYLEKVAAYDPEMHQVLAQSVAAAEAQAKPFNDLTVQELRDLRTEIDALWHLARRSRQQEIDGNLLDQQELADSLVGRMEEIGVPGHGPGEESAITPAEMSALKFAQAKAVGRRVESWVDMKDGSNKMGPFRRYVWTPIKEAADRYRADKIIHIKAFRDAFADVALTMKSELIHAPELGYTFGKDSGGVAMNEVLHALLHTGNESNLRKLLLGRKWGAVLEDGSLDTRRWDTFIRRMIAEGKLTKAHYDFAQKVWDGMEAMKPLAQKAHRDAYGKYFDEVAANSFSTPFGSYRGGYVPAAVDGRIVQDLELKKLIEEGKEGMAYAFPATSKGFTKARVEYNKPLTLDLRILPQHIDKVLRFSHLENPVRDAARLLATKEVSSRLNKQSPEAISHMLMPWLSRTAAQQVTTPVPGAGWMMRFLNTLRNRTSMAAMFANLSNTAQQITGLMLAGLKVRPSNLAGAMARYMKAPRKLTAQVAELSPYMAHRMQNEVDAMMGEIEAILLDPTLYERAQEWTRRHTFFMQSAVDNVMGPIIWDAAYNEALAENFDPKDAVRIADAAVRQTQGSTLPEDVSRIETGPAYARLFTQFAGYFNMQANLLGTEFAKVAQEMGLRKGLGRGFYLMVVGFYVPAMVAEGIAQAFKGGPGDEDKDGEIWDDWLKALFVFGPLKNATAFVPGVGQVVNSAVARFNHNPADDKLSVAPVVSTIESVASVPHDLYQHVIGQGNAQRTVRDVGTLVSVTTGLPAALVAKPVGYVAGIDQGKTNPTSQADILRGLVTGVASPESKH